ncbi:hypothetical protein VTK26DRAFT_9475 [Humicola hyalothermophila]
MQYAYRFWATADFYPGGDDGNEMTGRTGRKGERTRAECRVNLPCCGLVAILDLCPGLPNDKAVAWPIRGLGHQFLLFISDLTSPSDATFADRPSSAFKNCSGNGLVGPQAVMGAMPSSLRERHLVEIRKTKTARYLVRNPYLYSSKFVPA